MLHSPSEASAKALPRVSIKSPELNASLTSLIQDMVNLNGKRSNIERLRGGTLDFVRFDSPTCAHSRRLMVSGSSRSIRQCALKLLPQPQKNPHGAGTPASSRSRH